MIDNIEVKRQHFNPNSEKYLPLNWYQKEPAFHHFTHSRRPISNNSFLTITRFHCSRSWNFHLATYSMYDANAIKQNDRSIHDRNQNFNVKKL